MNRAALKELHDALDHGMYDAHHGLVNTQAMKDFITAFLDDSEPEIIITSEMITDAIKIYDRAISNGLSVNKAMNLALQIPILGSDKVSKLFFSYYKEQQEDISNSCLG